MSFVIRHFKADIYAYKQEPRGADGKGVGILSAMGAGPLTREMGWMLMSVTPGVEVGRYDVYGITGTGNGIANGAATHYSHWALATCGSLIFPNPIVALSFVLTWRDYKVSDKGSG